MKKLRFVAGGGEGARQFVSSLAEVYRDEVVSDTEISILPAGKLIFRQGETGAKSESEKKNFAPQNRENFAEDRRKKVMQKDFSQNSEKHPFEESEGQKSSEKSANNLTENHKIERTGRQAGEKIMPIKSAARSSGDIARDLYINMLLLRAYYGKLSGLSEENGELFEEMQSELSIVTVAMLKIYQNLSRTRNEPPQNSEISTFSTYCAGLSKTANLQRKILFDLRALQRSSDSQNLLIQLTIVYLTIQSQRETILQLSESEC